MPLSVQGLCDAEITTPASNLRDRARKATPGVVITPALSTATPTEARPKRHAVGDPSTRLARVLPDHHARLPVRSHQIVAKRPADQKRAFHGQGKFARDAANPIGSEELPCLSCHVLIRV